MPAVIRGTVIRCNTMRVYRSVLLGSSVRKYIGCDGRPVIEASKVGDFTGANVAWIFVAENDDKVEADLKMMMEFFKASQPVLTFSQTCLSLKTPAMKDDPAFLALQSFHKNLEEL